MNLPMPLDITMTMFIDAFTYFLIRLHGLIHQSAYLMDENVGESKPSFDPSTSFDLS